MPKIYIAIGLLFFFSPMWIFGLATIIWGIMLLDSETSNT